MTVAQMKVGDRGRVMAIEGHDSLSARLMEMGLTPGIEFELMGIAPMGDPLELRVRGYRLSLRRAEASRVEVSMET